MENDKVSARPKSYLVAAILALLFGWFGGHCFYLKKPGEARKHILFTVAMFVVSAAFGNIQPFVLSMVLGPLEAVLFVLAKRAETPLELIQSGRLVGSIVDEYRRAHNAAEADGRAADAQEKRARPYLRPAELAVLVASALLIFFWVAVGLSPQDTAETSSPYQPETQVAATSAAAASVQAATTSVAEEGVGDAKLAVTFVDVGQGDATIIELPDGGTVVVDAGPDTDAKALEQELSRLNITKIDHLVATHGDSDHIAGMAELLESHEVGEFMAPQATDTTDSYLSVLEAVEAKGITSRAAWSGRCVTQGKGYSIKVLSPNQGQDYAESNDWSIVLLVTFGDTSVLLTGDAPKETLKSLDCGTVDLLKVSHHGSNTGTDAELVQKLQPKYAVVSYAVGNEYGHPTQEVLDSLTGVTVYGTGANGTITATSDGKTLAVTAEKSGVVKAPAAETPVAEAQAESPESADSSGGEGQAEAAAQEEPAAQEKTVVVTPKGKKYHNRGCRHTRNKELTEMTISEAQAEGYTACGTCHP